MRCELMINTEVNKNIKAYKDTWESEGFLCIDNFLDETSAYFLHSFLTKKISEEWWSIKLRAHEEGNQINESHLYNRKNKKRIEDTLVECQKAFSKHILSYAFDEIDSHWDQCMCLLCSYKNFLKDNVFKSFMHSITNEEYKLIRDSSYKTTRYLTGHFLSPHEDETRFCEDVSMLLSLTKDWLPAYGGNLQITTKDQTQLKQSIVPGYNKLVLINNKNKNLLHSVTHVAPFVRKARYTLSARLAAQTESPVL
tara:strand:- start:101 stop:859 length:759 start_codon:yes stop_codon:yes gene_type:complete